MVGPLSPSKNFKEKKWHENWDKIKHFKFNIYVIKSKRKLIPSSISSQYQLNQRIIAILNQQWIFRVGKMNQEEKLIRIIILC